MEVTRFTNELGVGHVADNVLIENSPSFAMSDYTFRVAEQLGVGRLGGYVKVKFEETNIDHFSAEVDGTEDRVDMVVRLDGQLTDEQIKVHIAHEMIHAVQILTGKLIHIGLVWCEERNRIVYKHIFERRGIRRRAIRRPTLGTRGILL